MAHASDPLETRPAVVLALDVDDTLTYVDSQDENKVWQVCWNYLKQMLTRLTEAAYQSEHRFVLAIITAKDYADDILHMVVERFNSYLVRKDCKTGSYHPGVLLGDKHFYVGYNMHHSQVCDVTQDDLTVGLIQESVASIGHLVSSVQVCQSRLLGNNDFIDKYQVLQFLRETFDARYGALVDNNLNWAVAFEDARQRHEPVAFFSAENFVEWHQAEQYEQIEAVYKQVEQKLMQAMGVKPDVEEPPSYAEATVLRRVQSAPALSSFGASP